jgi:hypothetical protein
MIETGHGIAAGVSCTTFESFTLNAKAKFTPGCENRKKKKNGRGRCTIFCTPHMPLLTLAYM